MYSLSKITISPFQKRNIFTEWILKNNNYCNGFENSNFLILAHIAANE